MKTHKEDIKKDPFVTLFCIPCALWEDHKPSNILTVYLCLWVPSQTLCMPAVINLESKKARSGAFTSQESHNHQYTHLHSPTSILKPRSGIVLSGSNWLPIALGTSQVRTCLGVPSNIWPGQFLNSYCWLLEGLIGGEGQMVPIHRSPPAPTWFSIDECGWLMLAALYCSGAGTSLPGSMRHRPALSS